MRSYPIEWHAECLANAIRSNEERAAQIRRLKDDFNRAEEEIKFYRIQIERAVASGKLAFDRDRYMKHTTN